MSASTRPGCFPRAEQPDGLDELTRRLKLIEPRLIVFEATAVTKPGGQLTGRCGLPVVVVNPRQIRDFAKSIVGWPKRWH